MKATSKQFQQLEAASKSPLYTIFSNTLGGLETVRAFQAHDHFSDQTDIAIDRSQVWEGVTFVRKFDFTEVYAIGTFLLPLQRPCELNMFASIGI